MKVVAHRHDFHVPDFAERSERYPHYHIVPKQRDANLEFRRKLLAEAHRKPAVQRTLKRMCAEDILFWLNCFVYGYDPRAMDGDQDPEQPFITWPAQDVAITQIADALGKHDIGIEKSRDQGASWICLLCLLHPWWFRRGMSFMVVSRKEALVDSRDNSDSLFWKLDYVLARSPAWLRPAFDRGKLQLVNLENESLINGESTTGDVGRGGRRGAILLDEAAMMKDFLEVLAATQRNTNCRIFNSTHKGIETGFYKQLDRVPVRVRLHWSEHPEQARGLYVCHGPKVEIIDTEYQFPPDYDFRTDGKIRSPFYDIEDDRAPTPIVMANEMDINPAGGSYRFFPEEEIQRLIYEHVQPSILRGELRFEEVLVKDALTIKSQQFEDDERGELDLWLELADGKPPTDRAYVAGCDIGMMTTPSVCAICDSVSGEKVAQLATRRLDPGAFGIYVVALCWWFNEAFLVYEANGPTGKMFGEAVCNLAGYQNLYYGRGLLNRGEKSGRKPGFTSNEENTPPMFSNYRRMLKSNQYLNRSKAAVLELREYELASDGRTIVHAKSQRTDDPTMKKQNHGDYVIADGLCALGVRSYAPVEIKHEPVVQRGSLAWRRRLALANQTESSYW